MPLIPALWRHKPAWAIGIFQASQGYTARLGLKINKWTGKVEGGALFTEDKEVVNRHTQARCLSLEVGN